MRVADTGQMRQEPTLRGRHLADVRRCAGSAGVVRRRPAKGMHRRVAENGVEVTQCPPGVCAGL